MGVGSRLELPYRVRFDECGRDGRLRSSGLLRFAQDLAWVHSAGAGFDRKWYAEREMTWLIRSLQLDVIERPVHGSTITVSTEVLGFRRALARRRSEFSIGGEGPGATALIDWLLLDARGTPVRVPAELTAAFSQGRPADFAPLRARLPEVPRDADRLAFSVRSSEVDPMAHVNNAAYVDYIDAHVEALAGRVDALRVPRRYVIEFVGSARAGAELASFLWLEEGAWLYRLMTADGEAEMLRARVETGAGDWVGG